MKMHAADITITIHGAIIEVNHSSARTIQLNR